MEWLIFLTGNNSAAAELAIIISLSVGLLLLLVLLIFMLNRNRKKSQRDRIRNEVIEQSQSKSTGHPKLVCKLLVSPSNSQ